MLIVSNNPGVANVINQALAPFLGENNVVLDGKLPKVVTMEGPTLDEPLPPFNHELFATQIPFSVSSFSPGGIPVIIPKTGAHIL